jgi:poly-gamma-glutamate system protein
VKTYFSLVSEHSFRLIRADQMSRGLQKNASRLWITGLSALLILLVVESSKTFVRDPLLDKKVAAGHLMLQAMEAIQKARLDLGVSTDPNDDPNQTGVIGKDYTDLTTTLGSLLSKRTATNPNFAGVIVGMLTKAGMKPGDAVAISFSGSFPAMNIAVLSAVYVLDLKPILISSVGASTYGANELQLTWLDMERILREKGILSYASKAASLGGIVGTKGGLDGKGIEYGLEAIRRNGVTYLDEQGPSTLLRDIQRRLAIYERDLNGNKPALFINTGGPLTSLGNTSANLRLPTGLLFKLPFYPDSGRGIIARMIEDGIPVIHLLNIQRIAHQYGLPIDPIPLPSIPSGRVMKPERYSLPIVLFGLVLLCFLVYRFAPCRPDTYFLPRP